MTAGEAARREVPEAEAAARAARTREGRRRSAAGRSRKRPRAYTIIEVMMALAVLAVGAAGVIAMQKVTLYGNAQAKALATANAIAQGWIERLRADAVVWNTDTELNQTLWLQNTGTGWFQPAAIPTLGTPRYDVAGGELDANPSPFVHAYCTQIRLTQLWPTLIRAEVRVLWMRRPGPMKDVNNALQCPANAATVDNEHGRYGLVYLTSGIYQNMFL